MMTDDHRDRDDMKWSPRPTILKEMLCNPLGIVTACLSVLFSQACSLHLCFCCRIQFMFSLFLSHVCLLPSPPPSAVSVVLWVR